MMRNKSYRILLTIVFMVICFSFQVMAEIRMTAGYLKRNADSLAVTYSHDAKLALVTCTEVDTAGKSSMWQYVYLSADSLKEYHFLAQNNRITFDTAQRMRVGIGVLNNPWIDSDSALSVAERSAGSIIRKRFPTSTIKASITSWDIPPFNTYWQIEYKCSDSTRTIVINAATGIVGPTQINLRMSVATDRSYYVYGDTIQITVRAVNLDIKTDTLHFSSSCQANYYIDSFDLSTNTGCLTVLTDKIIQANDSANWSFLYPANNSSWPTLSAGTHRIVGEVLGYGKSDTLTITVLRTQIKEDSSYFPLAMGNQWIYKTIRNGYYIMRETVVDTQRVNGKLYYGIASGFPSTLRFWLRKDGDKVFIASTLTPDIIENMMYDFSADINNKCSVNLTFNYPMMSCDYGGEITLVSKNGSVTTSLGVYKNCFSFSHNTPCADAGRSYEKFARGVGRVFYDEGNISGADYFYLTKPKSIFNLSNNSIPFNTVVVGQFKDTTITITNSGDDTLKILNVTSSNAAFSARPTTRNVPPGQSFSETLRFAPTVFGPASGTLLLYSNASTSPDTIKVSGIGFGNAAIQLSKSFISFGNVKVGQSIDTTITITNFGNDTLKILNITASNAAFSAKPLIRNLSPNQSFTDTLRFSPNTLGSASGNILIYSNATSSPDTIKVSGIGFGNAAIQFSGSSISFGSVKVGQFIDTTITITNFGNDTLKISNVTSSNAAFSARPLIRNLSPNQSFTDTLRFSPNAIGSTSGNILVYSNAPSSPDTIKISGIGFGTAVTQLSKSSISFGNVKMDQFKDSIITITNSGNDTLKISNVTTSNAAFSARPLLGNLSPNQSFNDTLRFSPNTIGSASGNILVYSNAPSSSDTIKVSGTCVGTPTLQLNALSVSFGSIKVGQFKDTIITITNKGNDTLKISNIASSSPKFAARPTVINITPGLSSNDTLRFTPSIAGTDSALITIQSNANKSLDTIKVLGIAIPATNVDQGTDLPTCFSLDQNYPNPFNPSTTIQFALPFKSFVKLTVFDLIGREVAILVSEELSAGNYSRCWIAAGMPSGIYFYRLQASSFIETKKLILLR